MNPSFYNEIAKEIIRIHSTQITNFLKRNRLGVFYAAVAISGFLYGINVFLYKFSVYTIRDLMYYDPIPPGIGIISIFGAICLLFIEDTKKFLNKHLHNKRTNSFYKYRKILLLVLLASFFGLLYFFLKFKDFNTSAILLFLFGYTVLSVFLSFPNTSLYISEKGNDIHYILYIGIVTLFIAGLMMIWEFAFLQHELNSYQVTSILYLIAFGIAQSFIVLILIFKKFASNSDPLLLRLAGSFLSIMMIFFTLGIMMSTSFLLYKIT